MPVTLLALALSAAPPAVAPGPISTGQLYEGCVRYVALAGRPSNDDDVDEVVCEVNVAVMQALDAAGAAARDADPTQPDPRKFCLPESVTRDGDEGGRALARAFIDYIDRNPALRNSSDDDIFERALAEKWPCLAGRAA